MSLQKLHSFCVRWWLEWLRPVRVLNHNTLHLKVEPLYSVHSSRLALVTWWLLPLSLVSYPSWGRLSKSTDRIPSPNETSSCAWQGTLLRDQPSPIQEEKLYKVTLSDLIFTFHEPCLVAFPAHDWPKGVSNSFPQGCNTVAKHSSTNQLAATFGTQRRSNRDRKNLFLYILS